MRDCRASESELYERGVYGTGSMKLMDSAIEAPAARRPYVAPKVILSETVAKGVRGSGRHAPPKTNPGVGVDFHTNSPVNGSTSTS